MYQTCSTLLNFCDGTGTGALNAELTPGYQIFPGIQITIPATAIILFKIKIKRVPLFVLREYLRRTVNYFDCFFVKRERESSH